MKKTRENKNQAGFSIVEMIIVMVITLLILAATFSLMRGTISTANTSYETTSATQNLRNSHEFLTRDILVVGDGLRGVANIWLPTGFVTNYLTVRSAAKIDPLNTGFVDIGAVITDDQVPADTKVPGSNPATTVLPNTDRLTLLATDPGFDPIDLPVNSTNLNTGKIKIPADRLGDFTVGEIYYITSGGTGAFGVITSIVGDGIFWAEGDAFSFNRYGVTGPLGVGTNRNKSAAVMMRVQIVNYFVDAEGKLIRRAFGAKGASFMDSVIAEHIRDLQFRYILKPSDDGKIFDPPADQLDLSQATAVRIIEPQVAAETAYALQDGEKHIVDGKTQIGVRNIQFLEAPVPLDKQGNTALPNPGPTPKLTPTPTPTPVKTPTPIKSPTPVKSPTPKPTPTPVKTPTPIPTPTPGKGEG